MTDYDRAFNIVIGVEGSKLDLNPSDIGNYDHGDKTQRLDGSKFGISSLAYPDEDITNLTLERARELYCRDYWKPAGCDKMKWPVSLCVFDGAVQHAPRDAIKFLQTAAGGLVADGSLGPKTEARLAQCDPLELAANFMRVREEYYRTLGKFSVYGKGWINRIFKVSLQA